MYATTLAIGDESAMNSRRTSKNALNANFVELRKSEVQLRRIPLPRTWVNKGMKKGRSTLLCPQSPWLGSSPLLALYLKEAHFVALNACYLLPARL
jgi:hypothetical protein